MTENYLSCYKKGNTCFITLNRPEKRNAINVEMLTGLCELAEQQVSDPEVRAIIIKGEGKIFSAGVDFNSLGAEVGACITPERRRKVVQSIKEAGTPAIFVETTINPKQIREIAKETGVKIGGSLYSDSMGPEGSAGETYIGMMRENVLLIVNALK